ncbi:hypothetical protein [Allocoleopsis franciscana]|uniref:Uncharacterized protein n=1 Tax=Allocoleopsis franciscana PCC 7113 TaxID=1173027 RepID=K9WE27_9CYAN|nr:hypothetical protein [Allocoleopsis franciscana]AFZ18051.1 hypothetical protein Mic7113_2237 [Allocoleopsis franciscana PCC 7113]
MTPVKLDLKDNSIRFLYLFLVTDLAFIVIHLVYVHADVLSNPSFSLDQERGYSEIFQYIKEYWIALLLGALAVKQRSALYLGWSLLFFYLLLDDSLTIHEILGAIISEKLDLQAVFNLRALDFGELIVSAGVGLFFLFFLAIAYRFASRIPRETSKSLIIMFLVLAVFGIAVDMLHSMLRFSLFWEPLLAMLEDGGEMVVMSVIAWFVYKRSESLYPNVKSLEQQEKTLETQYR